MHIVYVIAPGGGPEAYIKTLLPCLEKRGHQISVVYTCRSVKAPLLFPSHIQVEFAPSSPLHYYFSKVVHDTQLWSYRLRMWEYALAIRKAVSRIDKVQPVDIVEVTEGHIIKLLKSRWKTVIRAHGSDWSFRYFCQDGDTSCDHILVCQQAKQMNKADAVVAISQHLADHLSHFCRFPREHIEVIPYGIDTNIFTPDGMAAPLNGSPILLSIGRLEHRKGTDILIRAMPLIWKHYPEATLYLLGNEAQYKRKQLLEWLPAEKRQLVIFPGFIPHEQLPAYYRAVTIYIAPTQYETFGYTLLEAMACGKPVVSTNVGAVPELVQDGLTGSLINFGDPSVLAEKVMEILSTLALQREMNTAARKKTLFYDINNNVMQNEQIYYRIKGIRS